MHQRPAHQRHLSKAGGAGERNRADAVLCAGISGRRFPGLRAERLRLWRTQADADAAADKLAALIEGHEDDFDGRIYSPDEGVRHAMELAKTAQQADHHRRHPGQSRRRRRFRHHGHAARAGAQQGGSRRHRRDLRSAIGQGRASGRRRRDRHAVAGRQVRHTGRRALQGDVSSSRNCRMESSWQPAPIMAAATWTWGRPRVCASAISGWS